MPVKALAMIILLTACSYAGSGIKPFSTDGCSLFPDGTFSKPERWLECCTRHDMDYWRGGTREERRRSDQNLRACIVELGYPKLAEFMYNGVRWGGAPWWPSWYRWGYGWDYLRGYRPLSNKEKQSVQEAIEAYRNKKATKPPINPDPWED